MQVEATAPSEDTLTVRLRQQKHNFGRFVKPFGAKLTFAQKSVTVEPIELDATDLAEEETLNATDRVELALRGGPLYPKDIAQATEMRPKTVKNSLTRLRKSGKVEPTGELNEDGAKREVHATSDAGGTP